MRTPIVLVWVIVGAALLTVRAHADTVMITGAQDGLGLALVQQYAQAGWEVVALCRDIAAAKELKSIARAFSKLSIEQIDLLDHGQIDQLAEKYRNTPIDVLINNLQVAGPGETRPGRTPGFDTFDLVMATNVMTPLKMAEAFVDHVASSKRKKIVTMTSRDSSIGDIEAPGMYFYRASKAAVNIVMVTLVPDLLARGIVIGLIAPGISPHPHGANSTTLDMGDKARAVVRVIDDYSSANSGKFYNWEGRELAW